MPITPADITIPPMPIAAPPASLAAARAGVAFLEAAARLLPADPDTYMATGSTHISVNLNAGEDSISVRKHRVELIARELLDGAVATTDPYRAGSAAWGHVIAYGRWRGFAIWVSTMVSHEEAGELGLPTPVAE